MSQECAGHGRSATWIKGVGVPELILFPGDQEALREIGKQAQLSARGKLNIAVAELVMAEKVCRLRPLSARA